MNAEKVSRELSLSEILSLAFNLYRSKFFQFFLPFLVFGIILGLSLYAITSSFPLPPPPSATASYEEIFEWFFPFLSRAIVTGILLGLISWIVGTTTTGVVIKNASDRIEKGTSNLGISFNYTISKLPSLLVAQFVAGILTLVGMLLFILPGLIIAMMFSLIAPAIIIEQKSAFESLERSRKLVRKRWLKTFALLIILGMFSGIIIGIANVVTRPFSTIHPIVNPLITYTIFAFVSPIYPIAITYLYYAMAAREIPPSPPSQTPPTS